MNPFLKEILRHDDERTAAGVAADAIEEALSATLVALKKEERKDFLAALKYAAVALNEAKAALDAGMDADIERARVHSDRAQDALCKAEEI